MSHSQASDIAAKSKFSRIFNILLNTALIGLIAWFGLIAWYGYRYHGLLYPSSRVNDTNKAQVIMYSTKWCPFCIEARGFFSKNKISYYDYNIDESKDGRTQFNRLNGRAVPLLIVKDTVMHGLQRKRIRKLLNIK